MKDKAKADYRVKTYDLIERLDEQVQKLNISAKLSSTTPVDHTTELDPFDNVDVCPIWAISWQLIAEDIGNQSFYSTIDELYDVLNSKEGIRMYPRGLYRELIEFSDKCASCKKWKGVKSLRIAIQATGTLTDNEIQTNAKWGLKRNVDEFRKEIKTIIRSIKFYENERDENEESFLREVGDKADS